MDVEIIFDHRVSRNVVHLASHNDIIRVTVSKRIALPTLVGLHPEIRSAITRALSDSTSTAATAQHA